MVTDWLSFPSFPSTGRGCFNHILNTFVLCFSVASVMFLCHFNQNNYLVNILPQYLFENMPLFEDALKGINPSPPCLLDMP